MVERRSEQGRRGDDEVSEPLRSLIVALRASVRVGDRSRASRLTDKLSAELLRRLRRLVGRHHFNEGEDIILDAHSHLLRAALTLGSKDGIALTKHPVSVIESRALDAIKRSISQSRGTVSLDTIHDGEVPSQTDGDGAEWTNGPWHSDPLSEWFSIQEIESLLATIKDDRRRLAFRLYMEGDSLPEIAEALGKDRKTIVAWIERTRDLLKREIKRRGGL